MRLDKRFAVVVTLSMLWGLLVAAVFYRLAGSVQRGPRTAESERPLVVAAKALPMGVALGRDSVTVRRIPKSLFPVGGFSRVEDVLDRPVISPIQSDEAVVEARLAPRGSGLGLGPLIPPGMRALSVRVNDVVGVAGFILPGMRVDVLATGHPPDSAETITRTVLQNITVLSAGQTVQTDGASQTITTPVVTLLVNPPQAEALTLAASEGRIQLLLRNSADQQFAVTQGRGLRDLYGAIAAAPVPAAEPARATKRAGTAAPRGPAPAPAPAVQRGAPAPEALVLMIRGHEKTLEATSGKGANGK